MLRIRHHQFRRENSRAVSRPTTSAWSAKPTCNVFRRVTVGSIDIKGRMTAKSWRTGAVTIHKNASLEGNVTAKSIYIEKGGIFSGQLVIGRRDLTQAELLPEATPTDGISG